MKFTNILIRIRKLATMGSICHKIQDQPHVYSKKSSIQLQFRQGSIGCCDFQFTSKTVNQTNADCWLIFVDTYHNVSNNSFMNKFSQHTVYKIQEYLNVYLQAHSLGTGQFAIIDVEIPDLIINKIAFLCLNIWEYESQGNKQNMALKMNYEIHLQQVLFQILNQGIRKLAITQFNPQFGIPLQSSYKILAKTIVFHGAIFRSISIICSNSQSLADQEQVLIYYHNQYEKMIDNGFSFQNSRGSIINILSPYKESISSRYI